MRERRYGEEDQSTLLAAAVDVRAAVEQELDDVLVALVRRDHQTRVPVPVRDLDVRAVLDQVAHHLQRNARALLDLASFT